MAERKKGVTRAGAFCRAAAVIMIAAMLLTACGNRKEEEAAASAVQQPGTVEQGVYLSGDGRFTVKAEAEEWQPAGHETAWELYSVKDSTIRISFSYTEGLREEMIAEFETSFADPYVEALREEYPDIEKMEIRIVNKGLAGIGMTMTDPTGNYRMHQFLYLASDGENGYLITAVLPESADQALRQAIRQVIESFQFHKE